MRERPGVADQVRPLRGREAELARLDELTATALAGAGGIVVLEGAAGIGKSRLLSEAQARAAAAGLTVAVAGADELDQVTPWGPLIGALSSSAPPVLTAAQLDSLRNLSDQRLAAIEQLQAALEDAASRGPVLVVLDDVQWADAATVLALGALPQSLFSYPVGWLLALRPLPARPVVDGLLERLDEAGAVRLRLGRLTTADAVMLARDAGMKGSDTEVTDLIAGADGNPFYVLQLLKAGAGTQVSAGEVPSAVRSAVVRHLRALSRDTRWLLQVASVFGRQFSVPEVAAMTGHPSSRLLEAVQEALRAELLAEVPAGLAFRHDLLRDAIYESLPAAARPALHRDAAKALLTTGAPVLRVAAQLAIGALPGDQGAVIAMEQAVGELARSTPGAAADLALRMLEIAGEDDVRRPELVLSTVRVLGLAGRSAEARDVFEGYLALHQPPPTLEAALQLQLRQALIADSMSPYPVPVSGYLLTDPAVDPAVAATLAALEQVPRIWLGHATEADQILEHAMLIVTERSRADELAMVNQWRVQASMHRGRNEEAVARAEAALQALESLRAAATSQLPAEMLVTALTAAGRITEALAAMRDTLAAARAAGRSGLVFRYQRLKAAMLLSQGNLEDAEAEARSTVELPTKLGYPHRTALPASVMVEVALRRGDVPEAHSAITRYAPVPPGVLPDFHWAEALVAEAVGDAAGAWRALAPILGQFEAGIYYFSTTQHHRLPQLVRIALSADERQAARAFAHGVITLGDQNPHSDTLVAAGLQARALLDDDPALMGEAVERAAAGEDRLLEAAAHEDMGRMLTTRSAADATEHLEAAYDFYSRIGAHRDTARVRAGLRTLGVRKRQPGPTRPRSGWDGLTMSEQRVAELVARGLTNREAASELFLSPDTINSHLRQVFTKLGIRSRVELARLVAERRLTPT